MKKWGSYLYCIIFFAVCLCPSLGMFFINQSSSAENRTLVTFPSLKTEKGLNVEWLAQAGEYFQEHFAFRSELVTANALINGKLLGVSTAPGVICGEGGWLYYKDSLPDYLGTELMSDRSLYNLAHSLAMMQDYLERRGIHFLFTVAPNKNSLYGECMPYYDSWKVSEEKNIDRLKKYLEQEQVVYADLYGVLRSKDEVLYHKRDSHWNNKGAAIAADVILTVLGQDHDSYVEETYQIRRDFAGDLDKMLYPLAIEPEDEIYYDKETTYAYVGDVGSNFDPRITTVNPVRTGSLVMYRDSFGNALLPFLADAYANAYFTRGVPYLLSDVDVAAADAVIVECAERFLSNRAESPPQMEPDGILWDGDISYCDTVKKISEFQMQTSHSVLDHSEKTEKMSGDILTAVCDLQINTLGMTAQITGRIRREFLDTETQIYIRINGDQLYEACPADVSLEDGTLDDGGFSLYLSKNKLLTEKNFIEVMVREGENLMVIDQEKVVVQGE